MTWRLNTSTCELWVHPWYITAPECVCVVCVCVVCVWESHRDKFWQCVFFDPVEVRSLPRIISWLINSIYNSCSMMTSHVNFNRNHVCLCVIERTPTEPTKNKAEHTLGSPIVHVTWNERCNTRQVLQWNPSVLQMLSCTLLKRTFMLLFHSKSCRAHFNRRVEHVKCEGHGDWSHGCEKAAKIIVATAQQSGGWGN